MTNENTQIIEDFDHFQQILNDLYEEQVKKAEEETEEKEES